MKRLTWLFLIAALTSQVQAGTPQPKSAWEFNAPDRMRATIGAPLKLVGSIQEVTGINAGDGAIQIGEGSYFVCTHGIAPNGGGTNVNQYTVIIDLLYPSLGWSSLWQTDVANESDGEAFFHGSGADTPAKSCPDFALAGTVTDSAP